VSHSSYLLLYLPICFVVMLVLEACRSDEPRRVLRRSLTNVLTLTLVLLGGGIVVWILNKYF
jgi:hypothetical protein